MAKKIEEVNLPPALQDVELAANKQNAEVNKIVAKFTTDFTVKTVAEAQTVALDLSVIKAAFGKVDEFRKSFTRPLDEYKKRIMDLFRPAETELKNAENIAKRALLAFQQEERRKAEEEAARIRKEQEAARKAEEERLKAEQEEAELAGDEQKAAEVEAQKTAIETMPEVVPPVMETPKIQGVSTSKLWKGRVVNMSVLLKHIVDSGNFENLVEVNRSVLNQLAKSTKGTLNIPGVEFYAEESMAVR